jgi:hypothetical protein
MTLVRPISPLVLVLAACSACGDDTGMTADAAPPDPCAPQMTFTGELLDWDSGGSVGFMGVFAANVTLRSDPSFTDSTAPNGRFEMCIPAGNGFADVTPMNGSTYPPGLIVINQMVLSALPVQSYRLFTETRAADFGFSASLAHVFVHVIGGSRTVTTAAAPGVMQVFGDMAWAAGNTGTDIYLGNIPVSAQTMLTVTGGSAIGPTTIPLSAGAFTFVTLLAN